jgi:hypothetical protein
VRAVASLRQVRDRISRARDKSPLVRRWTDDPRLWVEAFVLFNFLALAFDIYLAHSTNQFRRESEYVPFYFSALAPLVLLAGLVARASASVTARSGATSATSSAGSPSSSDSPA